MHTSMTIDPSTAGKFKGKSACSANCKCIMRLSGDPGGLGFACPATQPGITFVSDHIFSGFKVSDILTSLFTVAEQTSHPRLAICRSSLRR